jgi:AAA domain-containing protein/restriction endonuclease-like protein
MIGKAPPHPNDPEAVRTVVKLVQYLRDATASTRQQALHLDQYEFVKWISELPERVAIRNEPGQDGRLMTIPLVPRPESPERPDDLADHVGADTWNDVDVEESALREHVFGDIGEAADDIWNRTTIRQAFADRRRWQEAHAESAPIRELYEDFRSIAARLEHNDDEYELLLSAGLVHGETPDGDHVCRHLLTQQLSAVVNRQSAAVHVTVNRDVGPQLEDRQFLTDVVRQHAGLAEAVRDELEVSTPLPHTEQAAKLLAAWVERMLPDSPRLSTDRRKPAGEPPSGLTVTMAPAIVFRRRDRTHVVMYFERMLEVLQRETRMIPLGLAQLLWDLDEDQRRRWLTETGHEVRDMLGSDPLFPFPTNDEQRRVLAQLRTHNTVVVQGPPGTGKTHTTRNLVSALLAQGLRVLVTSQREQPLRVLRDGLHEDLRPLCVSLTGGKDGNDLGNSIDALSSRLTSSDAAQIEHRVASLTSKRKTAQERVEKLLRELHTLQDREHRVHEEISSGYSGTLAEIAEKVTANKDSLGWLDDLPESAPPRPPIEASQLADARRIVGGDAAQQPEPFVPPPERIPSVVELRELLEATALPAVSPAASAITNKMARIPESVLATWESSIMNILDLAQHIRLGHAGLEWPKTAVDNVLAARRLDQWRELIGRPGRARELWSKLRRPGLRQVSLYIPDRRRLPFLAVQAQVLRDGLERGVPLQRWRTLTSFGHQTAEVRSCALVAGQPPLTVDAAQAVLDVLDCEVAADGLFELWTELGFPLATQESLRPRLGLLCDSEAPLRQVGTLDQQTQAMRERLSSTGILVVLTTQEQWETLLEAIQFVRARAVAQPSMERLDAITRQWQQWATEPDAAVEIGAAAKALSERNLEDYRAGVSSIESLRSRIADRRRARTAWGELSRVHLALAHRLLTMADGPEWNRVATTWEQAWSWAVAAQFVRHLHAGAEEAELEAELNAAQEYLLEVTGKLAAEQAWMHCLSRMNQTQRSALRSYQSWVSKQGRGGSQYKNEYRRAEREAMAAARDAVPAWVMPIARVAETMPPGQDAFDVVIVDEASQAGLGSLFLLWLAPRIIVVGDDKQCTPSGGARQHGALFDRLAVDLPDIPLRIRNEYVLTGNLYNILSTRLASVIRLKEHFRCMPEIIRWSSRCFYNDQLVPLRQFGSDRLEPVVIRHVPDGLMRGAGDKAHNEREAEALVSQLCDCLSDPAYIGKTFGIITLHGDGQQPVLSRKLNDRVPTDEQIERKILIGTSAEFQGDERDVMFLSIVVSGPQRLDRSDAFAQRVNVAVTRARDQLWLFTSLATNQLKPEDLRYRLLTELTARGQTRQSVLTLKEIPENTCRPPFRAMFTQRVYRSIRQRGFHAEPYVRVGDRTLDIVIRGSSASVAVICDQYAGQATDERRELDRQLRELKRAGWPFCRVSHSLFVIDPQRAMEPVWEMLQANGIDNESEP